MLFFVGAFAGAAAVFIAAKLGVITLKKADY